MPSVNELLDFRIFFDRIVPLYVNVLFGSYATYNHYSVVVRVSILLVSDKIPDHRFPVRWSQHGPKSRSGFLKLAENSPAFNVAEGLVNGSIPCSVCKQKAAWAASEEVMASGVLNKVSAISLKMSAILPLLFNWSSFQNRASFANNVSSYTKKHRKCKKVSVSV